MVAKKKKSKKANDSWITDHIKEQNKIKKHQAGLRKKLDKLNKETAKLTEQLNPYPLCATSFNHERVRYFQFQTNMIYPMDYLKMLVEQKYSDTDPHKCFHTQLMIKLPEGLGIKGSTLTGTATKVRDKKKKINKPQKSSSKKDAKQKIYKRGKKGKKNS